MDGIAIKNTKRFTAQIREALDTAASHQAYTETSGRVCGEDAWAFLVRGGRLCMIDGSHKGVEALSYYRK